MLDATITGRVPTALHELSVAEAGALLRAGQLSSAELTAAALARIERLDSALHAFIAVTDAGALRRARQADKELRAGLDRGPLHGIPYALKDIIDAEGVPTTNASWLCAGGADPAVGAGRAARSDSAMEERLRAGGGVLLGKLTTYEFAIGGPSFDLPFPPARNPWSDEHVPSGSSSGAGAAVAAGLVRVALASDTSGSIRGPAFHCGTVGLKPTYGRVCGTGIQELSWTLDHFGPIAWTVGDAAALRVVAGADPADPRTVDAPVPDYVAECARGVAGLRVAHAPGWYASDPATAPEIVTGVEQALRALEGLGALVERVEPPRYDLFNACGRVILAAESFAVHERDLRDRPRAFGRYTYQRVMPGAGISAADLLHAYQMRRRLTRALDETVFARHDVLVTSCGQATAARWTDFGTDWPPPKLANDMQTIPFSVTGHPALSVPIGFAANGLPIGLQLVGRAFGEAAVLRAGAAIEAELGQRDVRPPEKTT